MKSHPSHPRIENEWTNAFELSPTIRVRPAQLLSKDTETFSDCG